MEMKTANRIIGFLLLLFVLIFFMINETYPSNVKGYTRWLLILLGAGSLYMILQIKDSSWSKRFNENVGTLNVKAIFGLLFFLILYIVGIYIIGYFLSTIIFITALLFFLNIKNWKVILLTNAFLVFTMYLLFIVFLRLQLPLGIIFGD